MMEVDILKAQLLSKPLPFCLGYLDLHLLMPTVPL